MKTFRSDNLPSNRTWSTRLKRRDSAERTGRRSWSRRWRTVPAKPPFPSLLAPRCRAAPDFIWDALARNQESGPRRSYVGRIVGYTFGHAQACANLLHFALDLRSARALGRFGEPT
ncbi:hypothetical protein MTO96_001623 [Rhipicephalus appendiculatus]